MLETEAKLRIQEEVRVGRFKLVWSLHIACAIISKCDFFITTDDKILSLAKPLEGIKITDPIGFIKEVLS